MENKCCSKCKINKPVTDFNKDSSRADGYINRNIKKGNY